LTSILDRAHLLLHIGLVDQPLLEKNKQRGLAGFPHLVVRVREELDDEGEEVGGDDLVHRVGQLLAVHRDVGHLLHQLRSNARFNILREAGDDGEDSLDVVGDVGDLAQCVQYCPRDHLPIEDVLGGGVLLQLLHRGQAIVGRRAAAVALAERTLWIFICVLLVKVDVCRKITNVTFIVAFFIVL